MTMPTSSYQVPKEVGRVGTESATFIEPIAKRTDGIQAMFTRQATSSRRSGSPSKRKREHSEEAQIKQERSEELQIKREHPEEGQIKQEEPPVKKKIKREDHIDEDHDIKDEEARMTPETPSTPKKVLYHACVVYTGSVHESDRTSRSRSVRPQGLRKLK